MQQISKYPMTECNELQLCETLNLQSHPAIAISSETIELCPFVHVVVSRSGSR